MTELQVDEAKVGETCGRQGSTGEKKQLIVDDKTKTLTESDGEAQDPLNWNLSLKVLGTCHSPAFSKSALLTSIRSQY